MSLAVDGTAGRHVEAAAVIEAMLEDGDSVRQSRPGPDRRG